MIDIQTDSRKIKKGDTFVALKGISSDGHDYIDAAVKNGATRVIVEHGSYNYDGVEVITVPDTREYVNNYLKEHYNKYLEEMTIIGVTGTNGKTTDCYLIAEALNKLGKPCAYLGTIGFYMNGKVCDSPNTTPDACDLYGYIMQAYDAGYRYFSLEASSHGLFLKRICTIPFDYAGFTNLTHAHLELHGTKENYAKAKQLLFKMLKPNGKALVNVDDDWHDWFLLEGNTNLTYGFNDSDYHILNYHIKDFKTTYTYEYKGVKHTIQTGLIGKYNVLNSMMPVMVLTEMGITQEDIEKVMKEIEPPAGRMNKFYLGTNRVIVDYAHTPDGVEKALDAVNEARQGLKGNLYTIFCCRGRRDRTMRPIMAREVIEGSTFAIMSSDHQYDEDPKQIINDAIGDIESKNYKVIWNREEAVKAGIDMLKDEDVLLILGKGYETFNIVNGKKVPMNDIKVINDYIKEKLAIKEN